MRKQLGVLLGFAAVFLGVVLPAYILVFVIESVGVHPFVGGLIFLVTGLPLVFIGGYVGLGIAMRLSDWGDKHAH